MAVQRVSGRPRIGTRRGNNKLSTPDAIIASNSAHDVFRPARRDGAADRFDSLTMSSRRRPIRRGWRYPRQYTRIALPTPFRDVV